VLVCLCLCFLNFSTLPPALVEFQILEDPDNYFLTWTPELDKDSVLLNKTDHPLFLKENNTQLEDPVFTLKKIPSLGARPSKREVPSKGRERSRTSTGFQSIFKGPDDSDSGSQDGFASSSPPSSPSPSPSPSPHFETTTLSGKQDSTSRGIAPKPLSKLSHQVLASSQDSLEILPESDNSKASSSPNLQPAVVAPAPAPISTENSIPFPSRPEVTGRVIAPIERLPSFTRSSLSSTNLKELLPLAKTEEETGGPSSPSFRGRSQSSPWLNHANNDDLRPIVRGTIRLSLKIFQESDNYKTVGVDSRESVTDVVAKGIFVVILRLF